KSVELDLHVNACGEIELHQSINRLLSRLDNIEHTLVSTNLVLITGVLVHVRRNQHGVALAIGRQRNRTTNLGASTLGGINDFRGGLIDQAMVESLQPNANLLVLH